MNYRTIIFDLDGTISDPSEGIVASINHALESSGFEKVAAEPVRRLIGAPLTEMFEVLLGKLSGSRVRGLVDAYREHYAGGGYRQNVLYAGMPDVLRRLAANADQMGVCTSKRADYAGKIIEMFGLAGHFEFIDGGDVHVSKAAQLERIVGNGVAPHSAVMIGDRAIDVEAARENDMDAIGVLWGFAQAEELERAAPRRIVRQPEELLEALA